VREKVFPVSTVTISLEDGFAQDHVVVTIDDTVVLDEEQVSTRYQISLAREVTTDVRSGVARVRVVLPERGLESALDVDAAATPTVRVSVDDGRIRLRPTDLPRHA
jgi:hypothetical protein